MPRRRLWLETYLPGATALLGSTLPANEAMIVCGPVQNASARSCHRLNCQSNVSHVVRIAVLPIPGVQARAAKCTKGSNSRSSISHRRQVTVHEQCDPPTLRNKYWQGTSRGPESPPHRIASTR